MSQRTLRLGTRRSALARAQSAAIARRLEQLHSGLAVELVGIDTRGDLIQDKPLSDVDGKEFFTAEIDAALRSGAVDFTVHSFKDLALERPADLVLGAVPRRENPRDLAVFAPDVMQRLAAGEPLRIGSSSPRRVALVPDFLQRVLPSAAGARVALVPLRGNVDTRLRRVLEPRGSERHLDGVILAFAGLARLWRDAGGTGGGEVLRGLLAGLPRMLLPLSACPTAPAQGALAIECRTDDAATRELLAALDDPATRAAVAVERALLAGRGGGCHQRFGATQIQHDELGALLYVREGSDAGPQPPQLRWQSQAELPAPPRPIVSWDGTRQPQPLTHEVPGAADLAGAALAQAPAVFIAHRRALPEGVSAAVANRCVHLWVSGSESWSALARRGVWVEGCAEGLGFAALRELLGEELLQLPPLSHWQALTHVGAVEGWSECPALGTYVVEQPGAAAGTAPSLATHLYWSSSAQFDRWRGSVLPHAHHACGPGKTAQHLRRMDLPHLTVFPSVAHWRAWLHA
ncbi:MAG TPA: hydroxymethylbilane synthase [Steroidobacteraceae bacterium]|nr:hydroxymethylbilane synthase [Steroidobacteraceae bacterium]